MHTLHMAIILSQNVKVVCTDQKLHAKTLTAIVSEWWTWDDLFYSLAF